ncbi:hypothetical protein AUQ43_04030 [Thalassospira sp. MCCC 1A01148]|uniref:Uncharacterized protein n=2 Tax=Thalassospiraceae TaxID=2844866 RepID=A0A367V8Z6_9PROT|nr:hypothetical protein AUQ43_04030 [Thalassospira sp. MCCC 1A01148]RCK21499.1 hypothetical protein TH6_12895 [Thalassospira profundimaris]
MQLEAYSAQHATNEFLRYHHVRACIYFGIGTLEAFLNNRIRSFLSREGLPEEEIEFKLRHSIEDKWTKWVKRIYGTSAIKDSGVADIFKRFKDIRNEITHPTSRDHSIYAVLDNIQPYELLDAVAIGLVSLFETERKPFPYWLLGWNYVGLNGDASHPTQSNNQNGFLHSMKYMGFSVPAGISPACDDWEMRYMTSIDGFRKLRMSLDTYPKDIEPFFEEMPLRPRLCRFWWDRELILSSQKTS